MSDENDLRASLLTANQTIAQLKRERLALGQALVNLCEAENLYRVTYEANGDGLRSERARERLRRAGNSARRVLNELR